MDNCIFCKIVAGELPAAIVHDDDVCLAFMDIGPIVKGHTLVIPKAHHDPLTATPDALLQKLIVVVRRVAAAQLKALDADGINVTQANGASRAHFYIDGDGANVHVGGDFTVQSFRTGDAAGSNGSYTLTGGQAINDTGT